MATPFSPIPEVAPEKPSPKYLDPSAATAGAFGGHEATVMREAGQKLEKAGEEWSQVALKKANYTNELYANDTSTEGMKKLAQAWGDYSKLEGRAAHDALPTFQAQVEDIYSKTVEGAPNDQARVMLAKLMRYSANSYQRYGENYASQQFKSWHTKSNTDAANEFAAQAVLAVDNPSEMERFLKLSDDRVAMLYKQRGYADEEMQAAVRKNRGTALRQIIESVADQPGDGLQKAVDLLKKYGDQMDPASRLHVLNKLRAPAERQAVDEWRDRAAPGFALHAPIADMPGNFIGAIKGFEGYKSRAYGDGPQDSIGWGTKAKHPGEVITPEEAEKRFREEITSKAKQVDKFASDNGLTLAPGTRAALISLTYNTGSTWMGSGLGDRLKAGDLEGAKQRFLQYTGAGGTELEGLVNRRAVEASWFGRADINPTQGMISRDVAFRRAARMTEGMDAGFQDKVLAAVAHRYSLFQQSSAAAESIFKQREASSVAEAMTYGKAQKPLTEDEFTNRYGLEDGKRGFLQYQEQLQLAAELKDVSGLNPQGEEVRAFLDRWRPKEGEEHFDKKADRYKKLTTMLDAAVVQRDKDPAAFALQRVPVVVTAWQDVEQSRKDPNLSIVEKRQAAEAFAAITLAEQERLGVPETKRTVLPRKYVDNLVATLSKPTSVEGGALAVARGIAAEAQFWGDRWPDVYRQIAANPSTSSLMRVLGAGVTDSAAVMLINSLHLKEKDLLGEQTTEKAKTITTKVTEQLQPLARSMMATSGADQTFKDYQSMATRLAAIYVRDGDDADTAAKKAVAGLIGHAYEFRETFRIPKSQHVDPDNVVAGAIAAKSRIQEFGAMPPGNVPQWRMRGDPVGSTTAWMASAYRALARDGVWVTSPKEDGLMLANPETKFAVRGRDNRPIVIPWTTLDRLGREAMTYGGFNPVAAPAAPARPAPAPAPAPVTPPAAARGADLVQVPPRL